MEICIIVTAAGLSTRFPPNKLLIPLDGVPAIQKTVDAFIHQEADVYLVTGSHREEVLQALSIESQENLVEVFNPDYELGLSTSMIAGIRAAGKNYDYYGFCNADKPFIQRQTVGLVLEHLVISRPFILVPMWEKNPGHPVFFHRSFRPKLLALTGDKGGRSVLQDFNRDVHEFPVTDKGVCVDMDAYLNEKSEQ